MSKQLTLPMHVVNVQTSNFQKLTQASGFFCLDIWSSFLFFTVYSWVQVLLTRYAQLCMYVKHGVVPTRLPHRSLAPEEIYLQYGKRTPQKSNAI